MNNLDAILEVSIGLVLTWLIISVATVEVQDIINKLLNRRAKFLEESILDMFQGEKDLVDQFYEQPVIKALYKKNVFGKPIKPDYIPREAFSEATLEMFVKLGTDADKFEESAANLEKIANNKELNYFVSRLLPDVNIQTAATKARDVHSKAVQFKSNAEAWFDKSMTKISFWYKDKAKTFAFVIGFALAASFNVDSIQITEQLWREPTLRQALIAQSQVANENTGPVGVAELEKYYEDLKLPVGWEKDEVPGVWQDWVSKVIGLLITGLAAMQGAPFWFDMLKKLLNIKGESSSNSSSAPPAVPPANEAEPVG